MSAKDFGRVAFSRSGSSISPFSLAQATKCGLRWSSVLPPGKKEPQGPRSPQEEQFSWAALEL